MGCFGKAKLREVNRNMVRTRVLRAAFIFTLLLCLLPARSMGLALTHLPSDRDLTLIRDVQVFEAAGRIGTPTTHELALERDVNLESEFEKDQEWTSGERVPFTLTYNRASRQVTFQVGKNKTTMTFNPDGKRRIQNLFIRTWAKKEGTKVSVKNLAIDGKDLKEASTASGINGLDILHISGTSLMEGFTLTGDVTMSWPEGERPDFNELSFQIIGTAEPVPEPATIALIGTGLAGLRFLRRKKSRRA